MADLTAYCTCVLGFSTCGLEGGSPIVPNVSQMWTAIAYAVCIFIVFAFAAYAMIMYSIRLSKQHRDQSAEEFCTAKGTQGGWRIGYSYFATAVGAWCIAAPSSFAVYSGILGLAMYAVAAGLPVLILSLCGSRIVRRFPTVSSIGDFAGQRFGPTFRTIVVLITIFNMGIAMTAEYTTMGTLFQYFVGSLPWPIIITVGILTMGYTMYGGLYISIITDQIQAIVTIIFILILTIYVAVTFREPLPPLPNNVEMTTDYETGYVNFPLGVNKFGYSAIFSMPVSLLAASVFSEAVWQKVWASEDRKSMIFGGTLGFVLITIAVMLFGLGGWLAAWAGHINWSTNGNLFLFQVMRDELILYGAPPPPYEAPVYGPPNMPSHPPPGFPPLAPIAPPYAPPYAPYNYHGQSAKLSSWIGLITLVLAVVMNEGAIDSLQNGITSSISIHFFRNQHILWTRLVVICINIPVMIVGTMSFNILQLFLITNMLTTCWFLPVLAGLWDCTTNFVGETGAIFGGSVAVLTTLAYSIGRYWNTAGGGGPAVQCGAWYAWYGDYTYDWDQFLVASGSSVVAMVLWGLLAFGLRVGLTRLGFNPKELPGISGVLSYLPGFKFITGGGLDFDLMDAVGLGRFNRKPTQEQGNGGAEGKTFEGDLADKNAKNSEVAAVSSGEAYRA